MIILCKKCYVSYGMHETNLNCTMTLEYFVSSRYVNVVCVIIIIATATASASQ